MKAKTVNAENLSIMRMSCDSKQKLPQVVINGERRMRWVGIGWVDQGKATAADRKKYPAVVWPENYPLRKRK